MKKSILFDLDGTLIDTAYELHHALDIMLTQYQRPAVAFETIRDHINDGALGFIRLGFNDITDATQLEQLRQEFIALYEYHLTHHACTFFPEISELLTTLHSQHYALGIVTNKHQRFTELILKQLKVGSLFDVVVCGDQVPQEKPAPDGLLLACYMLGIQPQEAIYIGDSMTDILAAQCANIDPLLALWGYKAEEALAKDPYIQALTQPMNLIRKLS